MTSPEMRVTTEGDPTRLKEMVASCTRPPGKALSLLPSNRTSSSGKSLSVAWVPLKALVAPEDPRIPSSALAGER